jgi:hypothetical protein
MMTGQEQPVGTITITLEAQTETRYRCAECDHVSEEHAGPLYECGGCGKVFNRQSSNNDNHQCPDCYKMAAKIAEESCGECDEGEATEEEVAICPVCDELVPLEDIEQHILDRCN